MRFMLSARWQGWSWGGSEELWSQAATQLKMAGHDVQASVVYWPRQSDKVAVLAQTWHQARNPPFVSRRAGSSHLE